MYHTLQKLGGNYLQFTPCLDPLGKPRGSMPYSITPELYGHFYVGYLMNGIGIGKLVSIQASVYLTTISILLWECLQEHVPQVEVVEIILWWKETALSILVTFTV